MSRPATQHNVILEHQSRLNRTTSGNWELFASHRREVLELLAADARRGTERLCVLGAGNCNDLDLRALLDGFAQIHLVDLDGAALELAVRKQSVAGDRRIHLHGGVDLTGISAVVGAWSQRRPSDVAIEGCIAQASAAAAPDLGGPFDVVLSPCVLSQLTGYASDTLGADHPRGVELALAIRDRHLRLLVELTSPGGTGILVTDMVSSDHLDELTHARPAKLPDMTHRLVRDRQHFPGLAPEAVRNAFKSDPAMAPLVSAVTVVRPWLWRLAPGRTFLVYALRFRRTTGPLLLAAPRRPPVLSFG